MKTVLLISFVFFFFSCSKPLHVLPKHTKDDGQLHGVISTYNMYNKTPLNMVKIPSGQFRMGPSDEDITGNFIQRSRTVSIAGFWMDATEISNNQYRSFVIWTRDSIAATELGYFKSDNKLNTTNTTNNIDWNKASTIKYDKTNLEKLSNKLMVDLPFRVYGKLELDPFKFIFHYEYLDLKEAAKKENSDLNRAAFIKSYDQPVYPDTLVWIRDFSYTYNDPMTKRYFTHPAFGNYPVVGVTWKQAVAFCDWRTHLQNAYLEKKNFSIDGTYRLPTEAEWEYAARGGLQNSMYPWGNYYMRNKKGCLLANFKPARGNYPEDGGFYTVSVKRYNANNYGLYNMSGNVSEWTGSYFYEGAYNFISDFSPDISYNANEDDKPREKRKVVRGGSWKDVSFYLQVSTRNYEYQDTAKSYIGFRCVIDLSPKRK